MNALPLPSELCSIVDYHIVSGLYASYSHQGNKNNAIEVEFSKDGSVCILTWGNIIFEDDNFDGERKFAAGAVSGIHGDFLMSDDFISFSCSRGIFEGKYAVAHENKGALSITITNLCTPSNDSISDIEFEIDATGCTMRHLRGSLGALGGSIPVRMPDFKKCVPVTVESYHCVEGVEDAGLPSMDELALSDSERDFYEFS